MITIQNAITTIVSNDLSGQLTLPVGKWDIAYVLWLRPGTNAPLDFSGLRDGSVVVVDESGMVGVTPGPDMRGVVGMAVAVAIASVGLVMFLRWLMRVTGRAAGGGIE